MYLDELAETIRRHVPTERVPAGDAHELFRLYAVLLLAKGRDVTSGDVHNAWSAWKAMEDPDHAALVPFDELDKAAANQDQVFVNAIHTSGRELGLTTFDDILFPGGLPDDSQREEALSLYKIMVDSSEALVTRRQAVNTFFLTMNGAILTASGLIVQNSDQTSLGAIGVAILAVAGGLLCLAWRSLITSFGQLNTGKFKVINRMERHFIAAVYAAEWEALGRGEDADIYRSFTSREIWVPNALFWLYVITAIAAVLVALGALSIGATPP